MEHAHILQQSHSDSMQGLKREATEEEGRDNQSFLTACGVVLQVCPPEVHGVLMLPLQLLTGNMSLAALLAIPQPSTATGEPAHPTASTALTLKLQCHSSREEATGPATPNEEPTHWKWKEGKFLAELMESHQ